MLLLSRVHRLDRNRPAVVHRCATSGGCWNRRAFRPAQPGKGPSGLTEDQDAFCGTLSKREMDESTVVSLLKGAGWMAAVIRPVPRQA